MRIVHNEISTFALRQIKSAEPDQVRNREKLASANRINHAGDDAAGLAVSDRLAARFNGQLQAKKNLQDAYALAQIAEESYGSANEMVQRMRRLAVQASNDTLTDDDRALLQKEVDRLIEEIDREGNTAQYNTKKMLQGSTCGTIPASATWSSLGAAWAQIQSAVTNLEDGDQSVTFTFSFMLDGVTTDAGNTTTLQDQLDGSVSRDRFKQETREAFAEWEAIFESVFNTANGYGGNLQLNFVDLGDEKPGAPGSSNPTPPYTLPGDFNVGDFRVGMHPIDGLGAVLAHGFAPGGTPQAVGNVGADTHFDSGDDWRRDDEPSGNDPNSFSVKYVIAHEIGHNLGLGHDTNASALMFNAVASTTSFASQFPNGLDASDPDKAAVLGVYGGGGTVMARDTYRFHAGADKNETIDVSFSALNASVLGISALKIRSREEAERAISVLDQAVNRINGERARIGAVQNRIRDAEAFNDVAKGDTAAANQRIRETDFAEEVTVRSKEEILAQSRLSALSQANLQPQSVLSLLGG